MTPATDDTRLGIMEGRLAEQSIALQDLREGQREINQSLRKINSRLDRLFLAILGIGATQIGLLITLIVRTA